MLKKALIIGITGQDGLFLTQLLLQNNYKVMGLTTSLNGDRAIRFKQLFPQVKLLEGNLLHAESIEKALKESKPDEVYNLGGLSNVHQTRNQMELTININGQGAVRLFETILKLGIADRIKIYQASTSELFGWTQESPQNEKTPLAPRNPYGISKALAHFAAENYRKNYGMNISIGILYNHESSLRGTEYVTRKISSSLAAIKYGKMKFFEIGDLDSKRDWGFAGDYVEAIWKMTANGFSENFVIATGVLHSVRDLINIAIHHAGLQGEAEDYVRINSTFISQAEKVPLVGNFSKAFELLEWSPKTNFNFLVKKMMEYDLSLQSGQTKNPLE